MLGWEEGETKEERPRRKKKKLGKKAEGCLKLFKKQKLLNKNLGKIMLFTQIKIIIIL